MTSTSPALRRKLSAISLPRDSGRSKGHSAMRRVAGAARSAAVSTARSPPRSQPADRRLNRP
jgi:hypothetical protein